MSEITPYGIVRTFLRIATILASVLGFLTHDARWFAAAAAFGAFWLLGDLLVNWVIGPMGEAAAKLLSGEDISPPGSAAPPESAESERRGDAAQHPPADH
ncbi:MAG: hypothetical protein HY700_13590 [Gemmatimonadetes bacterium]|nr:hypothetical protein [Gemmatimonadota bacterium]